jgi:hypothetical protein
VDGGLARSCPHPPENSARPELTGRLSLGFAKPMRGQWPPAAAAEAAGSGFALEGSPWGRRGGVPRGEHGTHSEGWAGDKDRGAAAPSSVLLSTFVGCSRSTSASAAHVLDPLARCWRALEHSADYAAAEPRTLGQRPSAHNFWALCLSARLIAPFQGGWGGSSGERVSQCNLAGWVFACTALSLWIDTWV